MGQCPLPVLEDAPDLRRQDEPGRDLSQYPPPQLAFNPVADDGPRDAIARFGEHLVAVVPAAKGALDLDVGEVTVPLEFGDAGEPSHTKRQVRNHAERSIDLGSNTRHLRWIGWSIREQWRKHKSKVLDACAGRRRHEASKVFGIGEKQEHALERKRHPVFEHRAIGYGKGLYPQPPAARRRRGPEGPGAHPPR